MTSTIKGLVSKNKIRYKNDGFDLDLTYISRNLIAMGFPADQKIEALYRNDISDVAKFLNDKHLNHYMIYNLCSESKRRYNVNKFCGSVEDKYAFPDHNPPPFVILKPFCTDLHEWLAKHEDNVAAIHCKAGKGRTGVMICTYLVHAGGCDLENGRGRASIPDADSALEFYGRHRTKDSKGVTIPSQKRYVYYYDELVKRSLVYNVVTLKLSSFTLSSVPNVNGGAYTLSCEITTIPKKKIASMEVEVRKGAKFVHFVLDQPVFLEGDIKFVFYSKKIKREKLFQFWFNTFFVEHGTDSCTITVDPCRKCPNTNSVSVKVGQTYYSSAPKHFSSSSTPLSSTSGGRSSAAGSSSTANSASWSSSEKSKSMEELEKQQPVTLAFSPSPPQAKHSVIDINFFKNIFPKNSKDDRFCDCNSDLSRELPASCTDYNSSVCSTSHSHLTAADLSDALNQANKPPKLCETSSNGSGSTSNGNGTTNGSNSSLAVGNGNGYSNGNANKSTNNGNVSPGPLPASSSSPVADLSSNSSQQSSFSKSPNKPPAHLLTVQYELKKAYELTSRDLFFVLPKHKLDKAHKDKSNKIFPPDFNVVLNLIPTLYSSGSIDGVKLSSECIVNTYNNEDYYVNYSSEYASSSAGSSSSDEEDNPEEPSDAISPVADTAPNDPSQCADQQDSRQIDPQTESTLSSPSQCINPEEDRQIYSPTDSTPSSPSQCAVPKDDGRIHSPTGSTPNSPSKPAVPKDGGPIDSPTGRTPNSPSKPADQQDDKPEDTQQAGNKKNISGDETTHL